MDSNSNSTKTTLKDKDRILVSSTTKTASSCITSQTRILQTQSSNVRVLSSSSSTSQGFSPLLATAAMNSNNFSAGSSDLQQQFARDFMKFKLDSMATSSATPSTLSATMTTFGDADNLDSMMSNGMASRLLNMNMNGNFKNGGGGPSTVSQVQQHSSSSSSQQQVFSSTNSWSSSSSSREPPPPPSSSLLGGGARGATRTFGEFASAGGSRSSQSISASSGFHNFGFPSSFSNDQLSLANNFRDPATHAAAATPSLPPLSPERVSFTFRNFTPPPWAHPGATAFGNIGRGGKLGQQQFGSGGKEMEFVGPDGSITRIKSSGQTQVTMSEAFMSSTNGSIESFGGRQIVLRESYGASESESDDDDEFSETPLRGAAHQRKRSNLKGLLFKKPAALRGAPPSTKLAIMDARTRADASPNQHQQQQQRAICSAPSEDGDGDRSSTICSELDSEISEAETLTPRASLAEAGPIDPPPDAPTPEHKKCFRVAQELLTTERTYVRILHLIDQEFHFRVDSENRSKAMFAPEILNQMFCNIKSLYRLHSEHLLPRLEARLERWEDDPRIGDIMKEFAPFLKMYSEYVQNFDNSINLINYYKEKSPRFAAIITEIQKLESCANLPITHHLIGPIQRIPRYRLLLEAYLKRLPAGEGAAGGGDRKDSETALCIVSKAAEHANEAMRRNAVFKKLLEVQEQIKGAIDLVSPTRTLIKEGRVSKISARNDSHQDRYLFLFSDLVLLCSSRGGLVGGLISNAAGRGSSSGARPRPASYQLRAKLDVATLSIAEGDDLEIANSFYICDDVKRIELYTATAEEKRAWMEAMYGARTELMARKSSLRISSPGGVGGVIDDFAASRLSADDIGVLEPPKIKSSSVAKCMECNAEFSLTRRRHHCHGCGSVVCDRCSRAKFKMEYSEERDREKALRVCESCKEILQGREVARRVGAEGTPSGTSGGTRAGGGDQHLMERAQGVLDVPGCVPAVLSGFLDLRLREKKEWTTRWFALRSDFVLYCYAKESDEKTTTATPIPGMEVTMGDELPKNEVSSLPPTERDRVFRLTHLRGRKHFFFLAPSRETALNWTDKLKQASKAEI